MSGNLPVNFEKDSEGFFSLNFAFQVVGFDFSFSVEGFSHWHRCVRNTLSELLHDTWEILVVSINDIFLLHLCWISGFHSSSIPVPSRQTQLKMTNRYFKH